jgi:ParB-like chromosome segregation protein Spo0J
MADTLALVPAISDHSLPKISGPKEGTAEVAAPGSVEETPGGSLSPRAAVVVPLSEVEGDGALKLRPEGDIDALATSIARLGQLFPVEVRRRSDGRYEVICGFRRVAALRLLKRDRLLARVHSGLSDADALLIAVTDLLQQRPPAQDELVAARERLGAKGLLSAPVRDALDRAILPPDETLAPELVGEGAEQQEEVELDTLAADVVKRLSQVNQDLALIADLFGALDSGTQAALLEQLSYPARLRAYLAGE